MTTATTNTALSHAATANFRTWVAEVIAQLIAVGLTQTGDTGQINTATVNKPAIGVSAGYAMFRFNDTLQATVPIFIKLEFGTGASSTNDPQMWITVGQSTNGAGTLTGALISTRVAISIDTAPASLVTPYLSRFCYSATQGIAWMGWKYGAPGGGSHYTMGGFVVMRSTNNVGATTGDAIILLTNDSGTSGSGSSAGPVQVLSIGQATVYNAVNFPSQNWTNWSLIPYTVAGTLVGTDIQFLPFFQMTPVLGVSASLGGAFLSELAIGSTVNLALVGSTTHTFVQAAGGPYGGTNYGATGSNTSIVGLLMLWE